MLFGELVRTALTSNDLYSPGKIKQTAKDFANIKNYRMGALVAAELLSEPGDLSHWYAMISKYPKKDRTKIETTVKSALADQIIESRSSSFGTFGRRPKRSPSRIKGPNTLSRLKGIHTPTINLAPQDPLNPTRNVLPRRLHPARLCCGFPFGRRGRVSSPPVSSFPASPVLPTGHLPGRTGSTKSNGTAIASLRVILGTQNGPAAARAAATRLHSRRA